MDQREFLGGMGSQPPLSLIISPGYMAHILFRQHVLAWRIASSTDSDDEALTFRAIEERSDRITAVGIGPSASRMSELLARNVERLSCLSLAFDSASDHTPDILFAIATLKQSDLVFVFSSFDDEFCDPLFKLVSLIAHEANVPIVGIVSDPGPLILGNPDRVVPFRYLTTLFQVAASSFHGYRNICDSCAKRNETLTGYALRHVVATVTNLINQVGMVCIDFADVTTVLKSGTQARMGVGIAGGGKRGVEATCLALASLGEQAVHSEDVKGALVTLYGSSLMTMDDYEGVSKTMNEYLDANTLLVVGMLMEEQMGENVRVTVMTIE